MYFELWHDPQLAGSSLCRFLLSNILQILKSTINSQIQQFEAQTNCRKYEN